MNITSVRQTEFAAALVDPTRPVPPGIISHRGDTDPIRFAVYRNNVHVGLVGVLAAKFPVCAKLVGEEFFTAMARIYVADHKPTSPIMMHYGANFHGFVGSFSAARSVPYLSGIAALEQAWSVAYNAADASPADLAEVADVDPDVLPDLTLLPHPATGLVLSDFPIGSIWSAHQSSEVVVRPGAEAVLVTRPAMEVKVTVIPTADAAFAQYLMQGMPVGDAVEHTLGDNPEFDFGRALVGLCSLGAFSQLVQK